MNPASALNPEDLIKVQHIAVGLGRLTIWVIYDKPKDYPHGIIARLHEVPGGPTPCELYGELEDLRERFREAGFTVIPRSRDDELQIVESWL